MPADAPENGGTVKGLLQSLDDGSCYLLKEVDGARKQVKTDKDVCEQHEGFGSPRVQLREAKGYLYFPPIEK